MTSAACALEAFYLREHLPAGGTDGARLDWARAFGLPIPIVNTRARLRVLPYHDLHHLVTGYRTDEAGEAEIGAWTLGAAGGPLAGRVYDLATLLLGVVRFPRRTTAAFYRGRGGRQLYDQPLATLLRAEESALRELAGTDRPAARPTLRDRAALGATLLEAAAWWLTPAAPLYLVAVVALEAASRE